LQRIAGTILASVTGVARALVETPTAIELRLVPRALAGMVALLLGNAYIVGINQIYDVEVDKINKPFLPMAAGEVRV
jgi:homogentisate solanesyltransferase